ncbi:DUF5105 domain-containing protein [Pseudogracilibacillus sp. ICA-222130]|uniref:DUF5105 domain-containing protein n=1 Tax=Pseudogracilibacillus sp. ICA-222130 TaxID=3134655 RepID=UPI0030C506F2
MRERIRVLLAIVMLLVFTACSAGEDKEADSTRKSKVLEATVEDGAFILSSTNDEFDPEGDTGTIKLNVAVKNITDRSMNLFPEKDMQLFDGDEQIDAVSIFDASIELDVPSNTSIGANKKKTFSVLFEVERNKEYELHIEPLLMSGEGVESVTFPVDMSEFDDTYEVLQEPVDVLTAYLDTIYFDEKDEKLEEMMQVDVEKQLKEAEKEFTQFLDDATFKDISDKQTAKLYETYVETLKDKGEYHIQLKGNSGEHAVVELQYKGISAVDVGDEFSNVRKDYLEKSANYDRKKADEYAISQLDKIIRDTDSTEGRDNLEIRMVKKDEKWTFESGYSDAAKELNRIFAGGRIY